MMETIYEDWFVALAIVGFGLAIILAMKARRKATIQRTLELNATNNALKAHYAAIKKIADDPALPLEALELLSTFSDAISSQDFCEAFANRAVNGGRLGEGAAPPWFEDIQKLRSSRPDIVENFHVAIATGVFALFLRWPSTADKFELLMADMVSSNSRKEAVIADRVAKIKRDAISKAQKKNNGDDLFSGGLQPV